MDQPVSSGHGELSWTMTQQHVLPPLGWNLTNRCTANFLNFHGVFTYPYLEFWGGKLRNDPLQNLQKYPQIPIKYDNFVMTIYKHGNFVGWVFLQIINIYIYTYISLISCQFCWCLSRGTSWTAPKCGSPMARWMDRRQEMPTSCLGIWRLTRVVRVATARCVVHQKP